MNIIKEEDNDYKKNLYRNNFVNRYFINKQRNGTRN